jgi:hypothetical protein
MAGFTAEATTETPTGTTSTSTKFTAEEAKSWLNLSGDVLGLGKSIWEIFSGKDYSDNEKDLALQMQLNSYQTEQSKKTTTIIVIAASIVVISIIVTLLVATRKK